MNYKDTVSKEILKRMAVDIARVLLNLKVERAEMVETDFQRIENRMADLVARMWDETGEFLLHMEIQNSNDPKMIWRMLRYRTELGYHYPKLPVRQYLLYIGQKRLAMADRLALEDLNYHYRIIAFAVRPRLSGRGYKAWWANPLNELIKHLK